MAGVYDDAWFLLGYSPCGLPTPDTMFVFDEEVGGAWTKWTGVEANTILTLDDVADSGELLTGDMSGHVNQLLSGTHDLGSSIDGQWVTNWIDAEQPDTVKIWRKLHVFADQLGNPLQVKVDVDNGKYTKTFSASYEAKYTWGGNSIWNNAGGTTQGGMLWNGTAASNALVYSLPQSVIGRRLQITFSDDSANTAFRLLGYGLRYRIKRQLHMEKA